MPRREIMCEVGKHKFMHYTTTRMTSGKKICEDCRAALAVDRARSVVKLRKEYKDEKRRYSTVH